MFAWSPDAIRLFIALVLILICGAIGFAIVAVSTWWSYLAISDIVYLRWGFSIESAARQKFLTARASLLQAYRAHKARLMQRSNHGRLS